MTALPRFAALARDCQALSRNYYLSSIVYFFSKNCLKTLPPRRSAAPRYEAQLAPSITSGASRRLAVGPTNCSLEHARIIAARGEPDLRNRTRPGLAVKVPFCLQRSTEIGAQTAGRSRRQAGRRECQLQVAQARLRRAGDAGVAPVGGALASSSQSPSRRA
jgi:hypothetical protein